MEINFFRFGFIMLFIPGVILYFILGINDFRQRYFRKEEGPVIENDTNMNYGFSIYITFIISFVFGALMLPLILIILKFESPEIISNTTGIVITIIICSLIFLLLTFMIIRPLLEDNNNGLKLAFSKERNPISYSSKITIFAYIVCLCSMITSTISIRLFKFFIFPVASESITVSLPIYFIFFLTLAISAMLGLLILLLLFMFSINKNIAIRIVKKVMHYPVILLSFIIGTFVIIYKYALIAGYSYDKEICTNGECFHENTKRNNFIIELISYCKSFSRSLVYAKTEDIVIKNKYFGFEKRFCMYCDEKIPLIGGTKRITVIFGENPVYTQNKGVLYLENPDTSKRKKRMDLDEIQVYANSADKIIIEKFVTFLVNYPPKRGLKTVNVSCIGDTEILGDNCMNLLKNNFGKIRYE